MKNQRSRTRQILPLFSVSLSLALLISAGAEEPASSNGILGPFPANPSVSLYLVSRATPDEAAWIKVTPDEQSASRGRLMVRAFDPEERLLLRNYFEPERNNPPDAMEHRSWRIPMTDAGVYQVRLIAEQSSPGAAVSVQVPPDTEYGVSFQNGVYRNWSNQPSTMYAYVPPKAEELRVTGGPLRILDETGKEIYNSDSDTVSFEKAVRIPVTKTDVVWRVEFLRPGKWSFQAAGFPFLLCPTEAAARAIRASVEVLPDGTVVAHKFQRRIAEFLPKLLAKDSVGDTEELVKLSEQIGSQPDQWMENPLRNQNLLGSLFLLEWSLRNQNLDPSSHWSGSIGNLWKENEKSAPPKNRWDRYANFEGLPGTTEGLGAAPRILAEVATLDVPFNPWFGRKELLNRAAASALRDLLVLGEDEVWPEDQASLYVGGGTAFYAAGKIFPVYQMVSPQMPENIREVWTDGVRRIADRTFPSGLVGARNQSAHYLSVFQDFAKGSGDPFDQRQAESFAHRFAEGQSPAGYQMEAYGPDGSYSGLAHVHMGRYYHESRDPVMREALEKSYRFFNHTIAPEPDGNLIGGFNFNHRIGTPSSREQAGGAKGMADSIPEIGFRVPPRDEAARLDAEKIIRNGLKTFASDPSLARNRFRLYSNWEEPDRDYVLPAQESESFERNFGDELLAVKRPAYYAVVYAGTPASSRSVDRNNKKLRDPLPDNAESQGGIVRPNTNVIAPFVGGGLSLFWTPSYGASLLAANWSPLTHHGLVGITPDKKRWWEEYAKTTADFSALPEKFVVRGKLQDQPLTYERSYVFNESYLETELVLTAEADLELDRLMEVVPLAGGSAKKSGVRVTMEKDGSRAMIRDDHGNGVDLVLETPAKIAVVENGLKSEWLKLQIPRLEIELPAHLKTGESFRLKYRLVPVAADTTL